MAGLFMICESASKEVSNPQGQTPSRRGPLLVQQTLVGGFLRFGDSRFRKPS